MDHYGSGSATRFPFLAHFFKLREAAKKVFSWGKGRASTKKVLFFKGILNQDPPLRLIPDPTTKKSLIRIRNSWLYFLPHFLTPFCGFCSLIVTLGGFSARFTFFYTRQNQTLKLFVREVVTHNTYHIKWVKTS